MNIDEVLMNTPIDDLKNTFQQAEKEIKLDTINAFYDKVLNFEDYIDPVMTTDKGIQLYSGKEMTHMIVQIKKEMLKELSNSLMNELEFDDIEQE